MLQGTMKHMLLLLLLHLHHQICLSQLLLPLAPSHLLHPLVLPAVGLLHLHCCFPLPFVLCPSSSPSSFTDLPLPTMHLLALQLLSVVAYANPLLRSAATHSGDPAPLLSSANAKHIPNSYIIKLKPHLHPSHVSAHHEFVNALHGRHESRRLELRKRSQIPFIDDAFAGLKHTFNIAGGFLGYSGHFDDAVIETIRRHPDVSLAQVISSPI